MSEKISIRKGNIDLQFEKKIITLCITNTQFLKEVSLYLKVDSFQLKHAKMLFRWVESYFSKYDIAPNKAISDIFLVEKKNLPDDETEIISDLLSSLSLKYVNEEEDTKENVGYYADKCREYVRKRNISTKINEINGLLSLDRIDDAEDGLLNYKKLAIETSNWINPFDEKEINNIFDTEEDNRLFKFPGDLGELIGWTERGTVTSIQAKYKTGKSFFLFEAAFQALISGKKVVIFSLEMSPSQSLKRIYSRITAATNNGGECLYPVADCVLSQNGTCKKPERIGKIALYSHEDYIPPFEEADPNYKFCTACRKNKDGYEFASWYQKTNRAELNKKDVLRRSDGVKKMFGDNLRVKIYPKFSASIPDIIRDLDYLETVEDFVADLIVVDYGSLLRGNAKDHEERHRIGNIYKEFGGIVSSRKCALFTASQTNRVGSKKQRADAGDISESFEITAHVDRLLILNQSDEEKRRGIIRLGVGAMRDGAFESDKEAIILQDLSAGQFLLDSYFEDNSKGEE